MNVSCLRNTTGSDGKGGGPGVIYNINGSQIELNFGINTTDKDGLNETFNDTYTSSTGFRVGAITIDVNDGCSLAHPYTAQAYSTAWEELLLTDNESLIFTALIEENTANFQSAGVADFQMMVLENGHVDQGGPGQLTSYYFFVELT